MSEKLSKEQFMLLVKKDKEEKERKALEPKHKVSEVEAYTFQKSSFLGNYKRKGRYYGGTSNK